MPEGGQNARPDIEAWEQWGMVPDSLFPIFERIEGAGARRLAWHILTTCQRKGERLGDFEYRQLTNYLSGYGMDDIDPDTVHVAQISAKEAQGVIGSRNAKYSAKAAFTQFEDLEFLRCVSSGVKGHSSLYMLGPFVHTITPKTVVRTDKSKSGEKTCTALGGCVHSFGRMRTQLQTNTYTDDTSRPAITKPYPEQSIPEQSIANNPECPQCGSELEPERTGHYYCRNCDITFGNRPR